VTLFSHSWCYYKSRLKCLPRVTTKWTLYSILNQMRCVVEMTRKLHARREVVSLNPPVSESELIKILKMQIGLHHCAALVEKIEKNHL
jgi:hypothetical protein